MAVARSEANRVYVVLGVGVLRSSNGGQSWQAATGGLPIGSSTPPYALVVQPGNAARLYIAFRDGSRSRVFRTTNSGTLWQASDSGLPDQVVYDLAVGDGEPGVVLAIGEDGVYRSEDGGDAWQLLIRDLEGETVRHMTLDPTDDNHIFAATRDRVYQSHDGGLGWYAAGPSPLAPYEITHLAYAPEPGLLYAGTDGGLFATPARAASIPVLSPVGLVALCTALLVAGLWFRSRNR